MIIGADSGVPCASTVSGALRRVARERCPSAQTQPASAAAAAAGLPQRRRSAHRRRHGRRPRRPSNHRSDAGEFIVEVDGKRAAGRLGRVRQARRRHAGAGWRQAADRNAAPTKPFSRPTPARSTPGRLILLLVDQGNIRVGQGRQMMRSAVKFVDGLARRTIAWRWSPFPGGPLVDFTTNHENVREGLLATVGLATTFKGRFLHQPQRGDRHRRTQRRDAAQAHDPARVRGACCKSPSTRARCEIEVEQEASEIVEPPAPADAARRCAACARCCAAWRPRGPEVASS